MEKPSVGRIVHYVSYGTPNGEYTSQCRAAIITAIKETDDAGIPLNINGVPNVVSLCVLNPTGQFFNEVVFYSEVPKGGTWHWPERI